MRIHEALQKFIYDIEKTYGPEAELTEISVSPKLMDQITFDVWEMMKYSTETDIGSVTQILGVPISAKPKELK